MSFGDSKHTLKPSASSLLVQHRYRSKRMLPVEEDGTLRFLVP